MSEPAPQRPHVLLTNDDGIEAEGLRVLAAALEPIADLTIVAPIAERSGTGHAISFLKDMLCIPYERGGRAWGWALDGMPADCVKVAALRLAVRPIDLVIAGINCGQNAGANVHYSGTVGAAREAALMGLPAIALSLRYHDLKDLPFDTAARVGVELARLVLAHGLPPGVLLNVNVPPVPYKKLRGWTVTRMGTAGYTDRLLYQPSVDGRPAVFRNVGDRWVLSADGEDAADDRVLENNCVSITPLECDQTAHAHLAGLHAMLDGRTQPSKTRARQTARKPSHKPRL
jgi:5'-nucleotidase